MRWLGAHRRVGLAVAVLLAAIYASLWAFISTQMERTFSLTVWDVGANYVLTNMSAPPGLDYGHLRSAPQNLIYLAFTPLTRIIPNPMVLVYSEDLLMAIGGIFIYLVATEAWGSTSRAVLVEALYLFNYSLFGAAYYPNHYEILFSVFFPIAYFLHLRNRPAAAAVFLGLAALTSSLGAVLVGLFAALLLGPMFVAELRSRGLGLRRFLSDHRYDFAAGIAAFGIFLLPFAIEGPAVTLSYSHLAGSPASPSLIQGLTSDLSAKAIGLTLLVVPFLPVIRRCRYALLAIPYGVLALFSTADHYAQFSYQYLYIVGSILFISWIEALRPRYASVPLPRRTPTPDPNPPRRVRRWRLPGFVRREPELFQLTAIVAVAGFFVLPYSPGNSLVGDYYSLPFQDYHYPTLVTVTPYDRALWAMVQMVPTNASVLIQENMPVLTNRSVWFEPGSYDGELVQYALADPASFWFDYPPPLFIGPYQTRMITWVNDLIQNHSYQVVDEYESAMLLARQFEGPLVSFVPDKVYEPGVAFRAPNVTFPNSPPGVVDVDRLTNMTGLLRTEGPLILPPGRYTLTYWISAVNATAGDHLTLGLWTNQTAPNPLVSTSLNGSSVPSNGTWTPVTLTFSLPVYEDGVYFGLGGGWNDGLSLESVYLNQTAAK